MSLRMRLLISLLALAAVGLIVVDAVSYSSLRSHLSQRVDQQAQAARGPATVALLRGGGGFGGPPFGAGGPPPGVSGGGLGGEPEGGPPPGFQLPPGTYGQLRDASGKKIRHVQFSYGETGLPVPALPAEIPQDALDDPGSTFTVSSQGGESTDFRVAVIQPPGTSRVALVAVPLNDYADTLHHVALIGAIVTAAVLIGLAALAWWLIRLGLRPLEEIGDTAGRIAAGDLTERVRVDNPRTEVGQLGAALNSMLGQIEEAFSQRQESERRMRRFLADASHELRTPLTSIRGYAELFRLGIADDPAELSKAMRRIEQESERMGVMVNDLLSLARLDEVRETRRQPVDLGELAAEACDDSRAATPDRQIGLEIASAEPLLVLGDPDQLHQVLTNLIANATEHTPAGTAVEVSLGSRDGSAVLSVRDHGAGLADGAGERVFQRFWRQSEAREREGGGAGLGLAIVAAVVAAHGGRAHAENHPDGGAVFTVELPVATATPA